MADHHDAQDYTANGPTDIGFRTGGNDTGIMKGVDARGLEIGVDGTGLGIAGNGRRPYGIRGSATPGTGVAGYGQIGVEGNGRYTGVEGVGDKIGVSGKSIRPDGAGVEGDSPTGVGVHGRSEQGTGVFGRSKTGRGGVFESLVAQVRLVPDRQETEIPQLPREGQVGDLKMIRNTVEVNDVEGTRVEDRCSLWLCIPKPGEPDSDISDQWQEVRLGATVTGIW